MDRFARALGVLALGSVALISLTVLAAGGAALIVYLLSLAVR